MEITTNTSREDLKDRLRKGTGMKTSRQRKEYLGSTARIVSGENYPITINGLQAYCRLEKGEEVINIPQASPTQNGELKLEEDAWDLLFQEVELVHELGHVLYTDGEAVEDWVESPAMEDIAEDFARKLWNALEDGAIERQLGAAFNVADDLAVKNHHLLAEPSAAGGLFGEDGECWDLADFMQLAALDLAKWDSGTAGKVLDPANEEHYVSSDIRTEAITATKIIAEASREVVGQPDPEKRVERIGEMVKDLWPLLPDPEQDVEKNDGTNIDPEGDDLEGAIVTGSGQDADELSEKIEVEKAVPADPEEVDAEEDLIEAAQTEQEEKIENSADELESLASIETAANLKTGWDNANRPQYHEARYSLEARQLGEKIESTLDQQLQRQKRSETETGKRRGKFDPGRMVRGSRGGTRIFKSQSKPGEKDYSAILLNDRSGSMETRDSKEHTNKEPGLQRVRGSSLASSAFARALYSLDIPVSVLSYTGADVTVDLPMGGDPRDHEAALDSTECSGGTPAFDAFVTAAERLKMEGEGDPFMIVVCDGGATDSERYDKALRDVDFPVAGVFVHEQFSERLDLDEGIEEKYSKLSTNFHALEAAAPGDVSAAVEKLASDIMF